MTGFEEEDEKEDAVTAEPDQAVQTTMAGGPEVRRTTGAADPTAGPSSPPRWGQGAMGGGRHGGHHGGGGMQGRWGGGGQGQGGPQRQGGPGGRPDWGAMMQRFQERMTQRHPMLGQLAQRWGGGGQGAPGAAPVPGGIPPQGSPAAPPDGVGAPQAAPWMQGPLSSIAQRIASQRGGQGAQPGMPQDPNDPSRQPGGIMGRGWGRY